MLLIPVIDLMDGRAVHARGGDRSEYRPLSSVLCPSSEPLAVAAALLAMQPFDALYIADLNAIQGRGDHVDLIRQLRHRHPEVELWIDAGAGDSVKLKHFLTLELGRVVIGSESLTEVEVLSHPVFSDRTHAPVLSLDFAGGRLLGPPELITPSLWPARVIVMSLTRVGSVQGPNLNRLRRLRAAAPQTAFFAAGGVRDADDLAALDTLGVSGVLLASALHNGRLGRATLARYSQM